MQSANMEIVEWFILDCFVADGYSLYTACTPLGDSLPRSVISVSQTAVEGANPHRQKNRMAED